MLNKKLIQQLKTAYQDSESERRQINAAANQILFTAKKIIFALHRQDLKISASLLNAAEHDLMALEKKFGFERLRREGSYRAALEEYAESKTFYDWITTGKIQAVPRVHLDFEAYLGGLCDLIGELARQATNQAAAGKFSAVAKIKKAGEEIMAQLVDFDFTGYLRTKYDQARGHLRKLEQMNYEIKLRQKNK